MSLPKNDLASLAIQFRSQIVNIRLIPFYSVKVPSPIQGKEVLKKKRYLTTFDALKRADNLLVFFPWKQTIVERLPAPAPPVMP